MKRLNSKLVLKPIIPYIRRSSYKVSWDGPPEPKNYLYPSCQETGNWRLLAILQLLTQTCQTMQPPAIPPFHFHSTLVLWFSNKCCLPAVRLETHGCLCASVPAEHQMKYLVFIMDVLTRVHPYGIILQNCF